MENLLEDLCWLPDLREHFPDYSPENVDSFLADCKQKYDVWLKKASEEAVFDQPGPTLEIDSIWHAHTLTFANYRADCDRLYKIVIYHRPAADLEPKIEKPSLKEWIATKDLLVSSEHTQVASSEVA
mmetsp:Transcript_24291/g.60877  ORF Transcript_24291/g.60877 Transcript_24291/m.60877 type:complete len:127 (-) Transcript_24291:36-416(-)